MCDIMYNYRYRYRFWGALSLISLNSVWWTFQTQHFLHLLTKVTKVVYHDLPEFWPYIVSQDPWGILRWPPLSGEASTTSAVLCVSCACGIVMQVMYVCMMCMCACNAIPRDGIKCNVMKHSAICTCVHIPARVLMCFDCQSDNVWQ